MVDNIARCVVDYVVRFPIVDAVDVQVVSQKIVLQGLRGAKFVDGEDVGFHIVQDGTDAFVLGLGVVVGLETRCPATVVVAIFQKVVLHHGERVLAFCKKWKDEEEKKCQWVFHLE